MDRYRGRLCAAFKPLIPAICNKDNGLALKYPKHILQPAIVFNQPEPAILILPQNPAVNSAQKFKPPRKNCDLLQKWAD
jgi:hypothetical protein